MAALMTVTSSDCEVGHVDIAVAGIKRNAAGHRAGRKVSDRGFRCNVDHGDVVRRQVRHVEVTRHVVEGHRVRERTRGGARALTRS